MSPLFLKSVRSSAPVLFPPYDRKDLLDDGQGFTLAERADECGFLHPVLYYFENFDNLSKSDNTFL